MKKAARILIVEDIPADAELAERAICKVLKGCTFHLVETPKDFLQALEAFQPDVILADYALPRFDGITALKLARKHAPFTPLIIWTGASSEDIAVDCLKAGANNYVLKENIKRLGPAVLRALEERELLLARKQAEEALQNNEKRYRALFENMPIPIWEEDYSEVKAHLDSLRQQGITDFREYFTTHPEAVNECANYITVLGVNNATLKMYQANNKDELLEKINQGLSQSQLEYLQEAFISITEGKTSFVWEGTEETVAGKTIHVTITASVMPGYESDLSKVIVAITDITESKRAEEAIQNSEKRLHALVQNSLDSICLLSEDGTLLWESPSSIRALNYPPNEHLGRNIFVELMHPDDVDWCREVYAKILQEPGEREYGIFRLRHADGTWHWVEAIITNMLHDPSINAIVANYRDINEQKEVEEALQNNEKRFRALIENGLDDISLLAADGTLLWESPSTVRNLGYAPGEYLAQNIFEIMHPDDLASTRNVFAGLTQEPGGREHGIFRLRRSDGTWRLVEAIATNFLNEPGINAVVINYRDITERKEAEEALREERNLLRTLIDNIPDRIYAMDSQGRKTLSNTADWQASGGKTMQDVLGKTDIETYPPELAEEFWKLDKVVLESGQAVISFEEPGLDAQGKQVSILTTKIPLRNQEGKVTGLVGIGRDITERKQVEEHLSDLLSFNEKILNHSAVGILTYEVTGQCVFANEKAASIVGTTVAQLMSQNFRSVESWKKSGLYDLVEKAMTRQSTATADIHHLSTFGKDIWMTAHCVTFKSKGRDHILLSISDITERKQAEEKLRQSENRYRLAVKATNDVIWESNLQTKQLFWSENARVVFGYSPEEVVSYDTWWDDHLHPDDRERVLSKINDLIEGDGSIWVEEYRFQVKDGAYAYISDRAYIERDADGTPLRMIGAMTDITERKQAEEKLRESENRLILALSGAQMSVWEWDLKTNQILWSPEFFKITGVDEEQFTGTFESFADLIHNDDVERVRSAAEKAMREHSLFAEEFRIICPDGEVRWLSNLGQAEFDSSGRHLRLIGTVQDVTQRKQAEIERLALLEIMQGFANTEDLHELLKLIHHSIARVVYAKNFFIVLYQPDSGLFEEIYSVDQYDPPAPPAKLENSITSYVFRSGEPLLLTQALFDELVKQGEMKLVGTNSASWLGVPLKTSGRTIGVMAVQDYEYDNRYSGRDKHLLASIATQVALAIERKQAAIELQQKNDDLGLLNAINEAVIRGQNLDSILELLGKELSRIFSVQGRSIYSTLYMLSSDRQSVRMQKYFFSSEVASNIEKLIGFSLPTIEIPILEGGHFHQALVSRRSLITAESQGIKNWLAEFVETSFLHPLARTAVRKLIPQIYKTLNIKSVIAVPLTYGEETIGFWDVSSSGLFTANDQKRIEYIGGQLTSVIQGQQANEKIRRSEEFLQSVQNALSASIAILNERGTIIQVNSGWREFGNQNGLGHPNACIGLNYLEICDSATGPHAEEAPSVAQAIRAVIAGQSSEARVEYPCHSPDAQHWFTLHITKFEDGDHVWVVLAHEDITERKRVEQSLALFRTQMDHITDAIDVVDPQTRRYIDVNEQACRMRGYSREEHMTLTVDDIDPRVATMPWHTGEDLSRSGSIVFESMNRRSDGSVFPVEVNLNRIHLDRDYSLAVVRDITERKRAEQALRESEEQYRAIFEGVQDAIFVESLDGRILTVNQRACEMFGYSYEEFLTKTVEALVPEGSLILTADGENSLLMAEPHETFNRRANGEIFPIDISGRLQVINGETVLLVVVRDITERKRAEKLLQESEDRFSSAFEYASIGMALVSPEGRWLRVNWALCELVGYSEEELVQKNFQDITYRDDLEKDVVYVQQVLAGEIDSYEMEKRYIHKSGKLIWVLLSVSLVRDDEGKPLYFISQIQDITERKEAEDALHKSEALYRQAIEVAGAVPYYETYHDEGRSIKYEFIGEGIRQITGYRPEEFSAALWDSLVEEIKLVGDLAGYSLEEAIRRVRAGENSIWQCEHRLRDRDGDIHWVFEAAVELRDENGVSYGSIGTYQDITERKQAEESLRAEREKIQNYLDIAGVLMLALDQEGTVTLINQKGCEILGYPAGEIIGKNWINTFLPESDREKLQEIFQQLITGSIRSAKYHENSILTSHGEERLIAWHNTLVRDQQGRIISTLSSGEDITERKRAEEELRASEERFRQLADNIQEVFWMTDSRSGEEIYMSPAAEAIWGLPLETLLHEPNVFINSIFPEDQPRVLQNIEKEKNGEKVEMEYRIVRPDGSLRWVWDRAFPIFDDSGRVSRIAGISADITERRESELALVKSQSRYRELFDSSPVSIWEEDFSLVKKRVDRLFKSGVTDLREYFSSHQEEVTELTSLVIITDANQASLDLYGVEHKEDLLKSLTETLSGEPLAHFQEEILGFLSPQREFVWEGTERMQDGSQVELVVTGSIPHGYEEDWSKVIVSIVDITERKQAEYEIRRRAEENSILLKTSRALTNLDLKTTLQTVGDSAKDLFAADGCRIFLIEPDGKSLRCVLALQENLTAFSDLRIKLGEGVTGAVAASGKGEIINEMQNDPRAVQVAGTPEEEEAIMFAPLKERGNTLGVLSVRRTGGERPFQPADLGLLEALASMAASAVSNARLFAETQRRLSELEALYENGLAVGRLLKPNQIGTRLIHTFSNYLPWHHVTIRLRQDTSDDLELVAFSLPNLQEEERTNAEQHFIARINKVGQGLSGWVIQTGIPLRTGNVHAYPQYIDTHAGIRSGLYMPLKVGERVIGVISVESEAPDAFTEQDERLLATLASQAAIAFENARLYQAIEQELLERGRAEEALRTSETHYRELADSITDILFELDQDLRYTHWNKASEVFSGISAEVAIGRSMMDIFGTSEEQSGRAEIYKSVLTERRARTFETEVFAKGEKRALEINAYPSARGVSVVAKDVTDRKRSEIIMQKRFELMEYSAHHPLDELMQRTVDEVSELTGSTIGFFHFVQEDQKTLGMQTWSTNALKLFNVPASEGTHLPLDQAGVWAEAVHQRRPLIQNDYETLPHRKGLPQGHVPIIREIVIPIIRNEKVMAIMGIGNKPQEYTLYDLDLAARLADYAWDITERKQMQVALEVERNQLARRVEERTADLSQANSNLARALRVKDEFLANMSHELRTPLNAILGLSESLGEQIAGPLNEKQQKYITTISESGHHLLSLINDILDLAKIEAGQITLDINKVDIHSVCQASLRMVKQLAQKKNQHVFLDIEEGLGLMWADERRLKQMIVNLLGNAVKFTPENGKIGLEVRGDQGANKVTMTVWDSGIGIKEDDLARLFQPFVQLDSGLAREATGTGLGLALVAQMARLHGGSVSAASTPGQGSRFSIILPWEPALAMDITSRLRTTGKFRAIKPDETNKPTILLVEDTKEVVMMLLDYLELAGYKVVTARDGVEAITQARLVRPDLILMDVMMPRMDGFEATRKLRSELEFKYTPIIALTALAMPSDRERCLAAGMNEYISKPINLKALLRVIQSCLFGNQEATRN